MAAPGHRDLPGQEHDAERDGGLDRRASQGKPAERRRCQGDAVRNGKRRDGEHDALTAPHQEQQGEHEQQVIEAEQDVLDAEHRVGPHHLEGAGTGRDDEARVQGENPPSCTVPSARSSRTRTSIRAADRLANSIAWSVSPPSTSMRQRCTAVPAA